jgi:hypothetical protein
MQMGCRPVTVVITNVRECEIRMKVERQSSAAYPVKRM